MAGKTMMSQGATRETTGFFGQRVAAHLAMAGNQIVDFRQQGELSLAGTRLSCGRRLREKTAPVAAEAAFSILHQLEDVEHHSCWLGGVQRFSDSFAAGTVSVIDLRDNPQCQFRGRFEGIQFYVPAKALHEISEQHGAAAPATLQWQRDRPDPIIAGLSQALIQATAQPDANSLLVDQLSLGLLTHFAENYGGLRRVKSLDQGGLAAWQERRAKEIMHARLSSELTIAQIAQECRLTPSHFARAFRRSIGVAPHRYLMQIRIDEAKRLLLQSHLSLADIGLVCGRPYSRPLRSDASWTSERRMGSRRHAPSALRSHPCTPKHT